MPIYSIGLKRWSMRWRVLVVVCAFFVRLSGVQGTSMYPTLDDGDQLLTPLLWLQRAGAGGYRGDSMADDFMDQPLVKRVIGIGGDAIDMDRPRGHGSLSMERPSMNPTSTT